MSWIFVHRFMDDLVLYDYLPQAPHYLEHYYLQCRSSRCMICLYGNLRFGSHGSWDSAVTCTSSCLSTCTYFACSRAVRPIICIPLPILFFFADTWTELIGEFSFLGDALGHWNISKCVGGQVRIARYGFCWSQGGCIRTCANAAAQSWAAITF